MIPIVMWISACEGPMHQYRKSFTILLPPYLADFVSGKT